jgi:hypothetical protein
MRRNLSIYISHQMHPLIGGPTEENEMSERETLMLGKENANNILLRNFGCRNPVGKFRRNVKVMYKINFLKVLCGLDGIWSNNQLETKW